MITIILRGEPEGRKQPQPRVAMRGPRGRQEVIFKNGRPLIVLYPAKETKVYQAALAMQAKVVMGSRPLLSGAVAVAVTAIFPVPSSWSNRKRDAALAGTIRPITKPDWDNVGKQMDAFKNVVWTDDCIVVDCRVRKFYGEEPMLKIEVEPLPLWEVGTDSENEASSPPCDSLTSPGQRPLSNTR